MTIFAGITSSKTIALAFAAMGSLMMFGAPALADDEVVKEPAKDADSKVAADVGKKSYKDEAVRHYNRGHDLHKQGFFNQAVAEYKAALTADERMEEAHTNLGLIYAAQKNYGKAMDAFKKSLVLNPNRTNALNGLGTVLYAKNRLPEAMEQWKKAVEIDPNFASAHFNMGNALENEKDFKGAIEAYVSAISISPSLADAYYRIGSIYAKQKHPAQAKLLLTRAIDLQPAAEFVREAKKTIASLDSEYSNRAADEPEVKMNIMAPPTGPSSGG